MNIAYSVGQEVCLIVVSVSQIKNDEKLFSGNPANTRSTANLPGNSLYYVDLQTNPHRNDFFSAGYLFFSITSTKEML